MLLFSNISSNWMLKVTYLYFAVMLSFRKLGFICSFFKPSFFLEQLIYNSRFYAEDLHIYWFQNSFIVFYTFVVAALKAIGG